MARIRTVKPDFWEDEGVAELSRDARLLFIGTWNLADDEGLLRWSPELLKAQVFPYDDDVTTGDVTRMMGELERADMVFAYTGGKVRQRLAYVVNFRKHQKINRPQPSRLPPPSLQSLEVKAMYARRDGMICGICHDPILEVTDYYVNPYDPDPDNHYWEQHAQRMSVDHITPKSLGGSDYPSNIQAAHISCNKGRGNRDLLTSSDLNDSVNDSVNAPREVDEPFTGGREWKGKGTGREVEEERAPAPPVAASPFDRFWDTYPRKIGKQSARRAWDRALPNKHLTAIQAVMDGVEAWARFWDAEGTQEKYIPHPATWLNDHRWQDEPPEPRRALPAGPRRTGLDVVRQLRAEEGLA